MHVCVFLRKPCLCAVSEKLNFLFKMYDKCLALLCFSDMFLRISNDSRHFLSMTYTYDSILFK